MNPGDNFAGIKAWLQVLGGSLFLASFQLLSMFLLGLVAMQATQDLAQNKLTRCAN